MTGNSKVLEVAGVTSHRPDPEGEKVPRRKGGHEPNGIMEGKAGSSTIVPCARLSGNAVPADV
jgi:predicted amidohydrolase YtcJ